MKVKRVFDDDKIATLDYATERRSDMIASLLGSSKEAQDIQRKYKKMIEVPQEEFDLRNFKLLSEELRHRVSKPAQIFE